MSIYKRAQQWTTFTRVWHLFDAKWQNPFESGKIIQKYLAGLHKPIYGPGGIEKAIYNSMKGNLYRHAKMERLHIYPDANVPREILENVTNQIRRPRLIPKRLDEYSEEEVEKFPKLIDYPEDYVIQKLNEV